MTTNDLFAGGPPFKLQARLGLAKPGAPDLIRWCLLVILIGWVPLAVLTTVQSLVQQNTGLDSFLSDFGVHGRSLIAAALLIFADSLLVKRLGAAAGHFLDSGLVSTSDHGRFAAAAATTRRLRDSTLAEVAVVVIAYAIVGALIYYIPELQLPAWMRAGDGAFGRFSPAGWWHALVSIPLLLMFFLGSLWRIFLWARFLGLMSRLDLKLVPVHPDRAAGLKFVGSSVRAFSFHGLTLGTVVAARMANAIVHEGQPLFAFKYTILGLVIFVIVLSGAPLLLFGTRLLAARRRGGLEYGLLASKMGREFERKWLGRADAVDDEALKMQDFSATTDLYSIVANLDNLRFFPLDFKMLQVLVVATLLPFVVVAFIALPLEQILDQSFSWLARLLS